MELWHLLVLIAVLLAFRVPVGFAFLGPSLLYFMTNGYSAGMALKVAFDGVNSFPLLAVPLFIFVGVIANRIGVAERLFEFCKASMARIRGNLAYVNVGTSVGFAWMSGSALADAAGLGKIQVPAMIRAGYPSRFATGLTASAALISPVMPPSIPAVIFASTAAISTGALFAASIIPAVLMAVGLCVIIFFWTRKQEGLQADAFSGKRLLVASRRVLGAIVIPVIILGGIIGGLFTPTEAAAVACAYMLVLGLFYRTVTWRVVVESAKETVVISAGIMIILASAAVLGQILARERVAQNVGGWLTELTENPLVFLLLVNILFLILGMVVDATAVILVTVPVLLPVAVEFGIDPVHFGVVTIINLMIGLLTPPVGSVLFVMSSITRTPIEEVFKGVLPFLSPMIAVLAIVTLFPDLVLAVPRMLGF